MLISLFKDQANETSRFKRLSVKKIVSLKDLMNKPITKIRFKTKKREDIKILSSLASETGQTEVEIEINDNEKIFLFKLKNKRNIERNMLKSLKTKDISMIIK